MVDSRDALEFAIAPCLNEAALAVANLHSPTDARLRPGRKALLSSNALAAAGVVVAALTTSAKAQVGQNGTNGSGFVAGVGGVAGDLSVTAGNGGAGGAPVSAGSPGSGGNAGAANGGGGGAESGGGGGNGGSGGGGAGGGGGGRGVTVGTDGAVVSVAATGGNGGAGQMGVSARGGGGGGGGNGAVITTSGTVTIDAAVTGGNGGVGGTVPLHIGGSPGQGGKGGNAIAVTSTGLMLRINAAVTGGNGAAFVSGGASPNVGGAGITGAGMTIELANTVSGGFFGNGAGSRYFSIDFSGGTNTLRLLSGWALNGDINVAGSLDFDQLANATLSNSISGTGSVAKSNFGTLTLTGTNTYSGDTNLNAGALSVGSDSNLGNASGALNFNGGILQITGTAFGSTARAINWGANGGGFDIVEAAHTFAVSQILSGAGGLSKTGAGTLILSGANTYAGTTDIFAGTLRAGAANTFSANSIHALYGGVVDLNNFDQSVRAIDGPGNITLGSATLTLAGVPMLFSAGFSGIISGTGGITLNGSYIQIFSGANTYSGATHVNAGTLQAGAADTFSADSAHVIAPGGTLDLNNFNQSIGSLAGGGNVLLGSAILTAGGDNSTTTFSGVISGSGGFTKSGNGTTTFTITNTYLGNTDVNAGTLLVNGTLSNSKTFVNAAGTFGGIGIVQSVTMNGGVFAPGSGAPGTQMTVNGALDFTGGGIYRVFVDPAAVSSAVVNGTATLAGATVNAQFAGDYAFKSYVILTAIGGVNGQFNPAVASANLPPNIGASLAYQGNDVLLTLTAQLGFGAGALNVNQLQVANTLNTYFNNGGALPPAFVTLFGLTGDALKNALAQASGEPGASVSSSTFMAWQQMFNMIFDPLANNRGGFGGGSSAFAATSDIHSDAARLAYAAVTPKGDLKGGLPAKSASYVPFEPRWSVWGGGYGGSAKSEGNATLGSHESTNRAYGFVAGADHKISPDTLIGFALAGGGTSFAVAQGLGGGTSDMFQASVYARQDWGQAYLMGAFGYGWQDFTLKRSVTISGTENLQADFNAHTLAGRAESGWRFGTPFAGITPYGAVQIVSLDLPGFSETATSGSNAFALSYSGRTDTQTRSDSARASTMRCRCRTLCSPCAAVPPGRMTTTTSASPMPVS